MSPKNISDADWRDRREQSVERAIRLVIMVAARWARLAAEPRSQDHPSQLEDERFLRDLADRIETYEKTRALVRIFSPKGKGPVKGLPISQEHLDALALRDRLAAVVRECRKKKMSPEASLELVDANLKAEGISATIEMLQRWVIETAPFTKGVHGFGPIAAAEALLQQLGITSPRRLSQTLKGVMATAPERLYAREDELRALTYVLRCLGLGSRPGAEDLVRRLFIGEGKRRRRSTKKDLPPSQTGQ